MIHYILLPAEERHALRREYRLRIAIVMLFFVSFAILIGIVSLTPAYLNTYSQENAALLSQVNVQKSRAESGADKIEKDLVLSQAIAQKILNEKDPINYTGMFQQILSHRNKNVELTSFMVSRDSATSTFAKVALEGKALTREGLLQFKTDLEQDKSFSGITLPLEDLTKSKNAAFNLQLKYKKI
jgi:hypothetical protein